MRSLAVPLSVAGEPGALASTLAGLRATELQLLASSSDLASR